MMFRSIATCIAATGIVIGSYAQTISFNTPLPWVTLRNDTITVRAQIDTAALKGKFLSMSLYKEGKGRKIRIAQKKFKITDPSGEFSFGSIKKSLLGGDSYCAIAWKIVGGKKDENGEISPVGIANLSSLKTADTIIAVHVPENASTKDVAAKVGGTLSSLGKISYSLAWNKNNLFIVLKKSTAGDTFTVALDGKCGKNAFLSYPDRFIETVLDDSCTINGYHYERAIKDKSMKYDRKEWYSEIAEDASGDVIVVRMPWYDSGIIPFEERTIGAALFSGTATKSRAKRIPAKAQYYIPATWGVVLLQK